jgi:hypothetical protein
VGLRRSLRDHELVGDLGVGQAPGHELEHLDLARGELLERGRRCGVGGRVPGELGDHAASDRGGEQSLPGRGRPDRLDELLRWRVLEQESARSRAEGLVEVLVVVERGHDDDVRRRVELCEEAAGRRDAVQDRHADVHDHDRRPAAAGLLDGLRAVPRFGDHLHVGLRLQDHAEPGAHHLLVVGDQDRERHQRSTVGRRATRA